MRQKSVAMEHKQEIDHKEPLLGGELTFATTDEDVSFFHDFIAGGVAGSLSVVVGHPFDTLKVSQKHINVDPFHKKLSTDMVFFRSECKPLADRYCH